MTRETDPISLNNPTNLVGGRAAILVSLLIAALVASLLVILPGSPARAEPHCPPEDYPCVPDPDETPPPPKGRVEITSRAETSLGLRLTVPSAATSYLLERQSGTSWVAVRSGTTRGVFSVTHSGLSRDRQYCYRLRATNANGSSYSTTVCAYTRDGRAIDVGRVEARIQTSTVSNAGTDGDVSVTVSGAGPGIGGTTWLDHGRDDFEGGDLHNYDLIIPGVDELSDITQIMVRNSDSDDWCVRAFTLLVDGKTAYRYDFGTTGCRWLGADSPATYVTFSHSGLRSSSNWSQFTEVERFVFTEISDSVTEATLTIDQEDLEEMMESRVGHAIHGNELYWGETTGESVEVRRSGSRILGVDLDLAADVDNFFDPEVDVDFQLHASASVNSDNKPVADIAMRNLTVDVDYDWWLEAMSFLVPCGPVATVLTQDAIPDCIQALENHIEGEVRSQAPTFDEHYGSDYGVAAFTVEVTAGADLVFTATLNT